MSTGRSNPLKRYWMCAAALVAASMTGIGASAGCSHIVPVQAARNTQVESYYHTYDIPDKPTGRLLFGQLLGRDNICALKDEDWEAYLNDAIDNRFEVTGQITLSVSVYPRDTNKFFVEGMGHYLVRKKDTRELIASANFLVVDDGPRSFQRGDHTIELRIRQVLSRQFREECKSYVHPSELVARVYIKEIDPEGVFMIADGEHELGLRIHPALPREEAAKDEDRPDGGGQADASQARSKLEIDYSEDIEVWPGGCLTFASRGDSRKLIDVREMGDLIKDDYSKLLADAGPYDEKKYTPGTILWRGKPRCRHDGDDYGKLNLDPMPLSSRLDVIKCDPARVTCESSPAMAPQVPTTAPSSTPTSQPVPPKK